MLITHAKVALIKKAVQQQKAVEHLAKQDCLAAKAVQQPKAVEHPAKLSLAAKAIQQPKAVEHPAEPASLAAKAVQQPAQPAPSDASKFLNAAQIMMCVPGATSAGKDETPKMIQGAFDLFVGMHPKDPIDAMLATHMINISNLSNTALARAAHLPPELGDPTFLTALKGATVFIDLVKTYDARRSQKAEKAEKVTVGQVNVESGGQAIVGTVETGSKKE